MDIDQSSSSSTYKTDIHKLYHLLLQFKMYNNPDKIYSRKLRLKRTGPTSSEVTVSHSSFQSGYQASGLRKKMKHSDRDPDSSLESNLPMDSFSATTKEGGGSPPPPLPTPPPPHHPLSEDEPTPSNIIIVKTDEYEKIKTTKYSLTDLRTLCIHYGIKRSGTKPELTLRIYTHLKQSHVIVKIQRSFRRYISSKYRVLSGPGYLRVKNCVNDTDFYTFDKLSEIAPQNVFTFLDRDGKIYGFHIASIYNLILNSFPDITNPYNRNVLPIKIIQNVYDKLIYGSLLRFRARIKLDEPDDDTAAAGDESQERERELNVLSREKQEELFIVGLFQHINTLGNYSDSEWFTTLQRADFLRFIRNLHDIWYYRANLSHEMKERICPPTGNPFMLNNVGVNMSVVYLLSDSELRTIAVSIISNIVTRGVTREDQCLGAFYVLATLTIVNQNARNALPWLYEAVL
jgi:hypothetical protein